MLIKDGFPLISNKRKFFVSKAVLKEKLLIFQDDPNLLLMKQFESSAPVPIEIFALFVNSLKGDLPNINESNVYYYLALSLEFGYLKLEKECEKCIESNESISKAIEQLNDPKSSIDKTILENTVIHKFDKSLFSNEQFMSLPIDSIYNILQNQKFFDQNEYLDFIISILSIRGSEALKLLDLVDILKLTNSEFLKFSSIIRYYPPSEQKWLLIISKLIEKNTVLQKENDQMKSMMDKHMKFFIKSFPMDRVKRGVLDYLKHSQETKFDRKFIASQSSRDIYNLIDSSSCDIFRSGSSDFWITFEFEKPVSIVGIKLQSTESDFLSSFQILDGRDIIYISQNEKNLQKPHRIATIQFSPRIMQQLTIQQVGNIPFEIKYVEFASLDDEFPEGIFKKLIQDSGGNSHKARVKITAKNFDLETFHSLSELSNISTLAEDVNWFQVEFLEGEIYVTGYRLKRTQGLLLRGWKIFGSDSDSIPLDEWTLLDERFENKLNQYDLLDYYEINRKTDKRFRFLRIVCDTDKWNGTKNLTFYNIDFFGDYFMR